MGGGSGILRGMTIPSPQTNAQRRAIAKLVARYGEPVYINEAHATQAVWVDFNPVPGRLYGSVWRITPDGTAKEFGEALIDQ